MKSKKGFSLAELLIVVGLLGITLAIAVPVFITVRKATLEKQYQNIRTEIENKAEEYAKDTSIITVSVAKLIEEGYLIPDDETDIYNPINNESLNCNIVEVSLENGEYTATLTDNGGYNEETNTCQPYSIKTASLIKAECYSENNDTVELAKCNETLTNTDNSWYSGSVKLTPVVGEDKTATSYRWTSLTGEACANDHFIVTTETAKSTTFNLAITYSDGSSESGSLIVQIDNEAPSILNINKDDNWGGTKKSVSIDATDGAFSGIDSYYVGKSATCDGDFVDTNNFTLEVGTYYACVKDKAGNISEVKEFQIDKIDKTAPTALKINNSYFTTISSTMGITYYSELTRGITFTDTESGVSEVKYCFTTKDKCEPTTVGHTTIGAEGTSQFSYPANKDKQRVCVLGIDTVGNKSEIYCDTTYLVDTTAPSTVTADVVNNSNIVNVTATDTESNINKYICRYGTSSSNLNQSVTADANKCNLGVLSSGTTYYLEVDAYNNANLVTKTKQSSFKAQITAETAFNEICGEGEYCTKPYYITYNNYVFVAYRKNTQGIKFVYNGVYNNNVYLQSSCCNNGNCTYNGAHYTNGALSSYLNNTFLNNLPYYSSKLVRGTWHTGLKDNVTARTASAYVGLMDYAEYQATKNSSFIYSSVQGYRTWLLTPISTSSYIQNYTIQYNGGTSFTEGSLVVNSSAYSRPVIVLNKSVVFVSGNGTLANPYRVV